MADIHKTLNPFGMDASYVPDNIPHHPIMVPKIDLLVGEEINRQFDFTAIVTNPDAISAKEEGKKQFLKQRFSEFIQSTGEDPQEIERKFKELEKDIHTWQDKKELLANRILRHYWEEQGFSSKFNEEKFSVIFLLLLLLIYYTVFKIMQNLVILLL
mgnify:CR=1 FL=1